jgi:transposase-like protein
MSRATRAEWVKRVERWQDSGLTAKEFAAELDVTASALTYWKLKLRRERAVGTKEATATASPTSKFLQLVPMSVQADTGAPLELILRGGVIVRVPRDFDEPTLSRVLAMIGGQ